MYLKPLELEGQQSVSVIPLFQVIIQILDFGFQGDLFFIASLSLHSVNSPFKLLNSEVLHLFKTIYLYDTCIILYLNGIVDK